MQTSLLVVLAALAVASLGVFGATTAMTPSAGGMAGMPAGMGSGPMGPGMHGGGMHGGAMMGDCACDGQAECQQHMYEHGYDGP